jgi:PTH1 family peptidyl-tRNA hydrolase
MNKILVVGLGNPGPEYQDTRHNLGFMVLDHLARENGTHFVQDRYAHYSDFKLKGTSFILIKPNTFVNRSGKAVHYWLQNQKLDISQLLVIVDELALPFGTLRLKTKGSDAGHNGLKDIQLSLSSSDYSRIRFGIGRNFSPGRQADYVLSGFEKEEVKELPALIQKCSEMVISFGLSGSERTMNQFNS